MGNLLDRLNKEIEQLIGAKVAIYGTGNNAKYCLPVLEKLDIICFLDGKKSRGEFEKYSILSINEAIEAGVEIIIIATELQIEKIIYDRISDICRQNNIKIYGIMGGFLQDAFSRIKEQPVDSGNAKECLLKLIDSHDTISFDIFDTLLMRRTFDPEDVFDIVRIRARQEGIDIPNFKMIRMRAARNVLCKHGLLKDIYDEVQIISGIDDETKKVLEEIELDVESKILLPRKDVVDCYNYAISKGKNVYIVSDMYLESTFLEQVLEKNGISGYQKLYVSEEQSTRKSESLFNKFREEIDGLSYLHIGDNYVFDGLFSCIEGIDSYVIKSSRKIIEETEMGEMISYLSNSNEKNIIGLIMAELFNSPFLPVYNKKIRINSSKELISGFIAPIEIVFTIWLIRKIRRLKVKKVLFAARDGVVFEKVYRMLKKCREFENMPESMYFYTSRTAAIRAAICSEELFKEACSYYGNDIIEKMLDGKYDLEKSKTYRNNYLKYLEKSGIELNEEYAFIDLTSCGTTQYYLEKMGMQLKGLYFQQYLGNLERIPDIQAMLSVDNLDTNKNVLLETFIGSVEPMVESFDKEGKPVFAIDRRTEKAKQLIDENYRITTTLTDFFISNMYDSEIDVNPKLIIRLIDVVCHGMVIGVADIFKEVFIDDGVWGDVVRVHFCS